jgi:hypothetical protein
MWGGWKVWIPYSKINNVDPFGSNLFFLAIDLLEKIRRKAF